MGRDGQGGYEKGEITMKAFLENSGTATAKDAQIVVQQTLPGQLFWIPVESVGVTNSKVPNAFFVQIKEPIHPLMSVPAFVVVGLQKGSDRHLPSKWRNANLID